MKNNILGHILYSNIAILDVLWGQRIKQNQVASASELLENQWNDLLFFKIIPSHFCRASEASKIDFFKKPIWKVDRTGYLDWGWLQICSFCLLLNSTILWWHEMENLKPRSSGFVICTRRCAKNQDKWFIIMKKLIFAMLFILTMNRKIWLQRYVFFPRNN